MSKDWKEASSAWFSVRRMCAREAVIGIEIPWKDVWRGLKRVEQSLRYRYDRAVESVLNTFVPVGSDLSQKDMFARALKFVRDALPPRARQGWSCILYYDERANMLVPLAVHPPFEADGDAVDALTYDLSEPSCRGIVADCAREALSWSQNPSAKFPHPIIVDNVRGKDFRGHYRQIDPKTRSEAAIALFWDNKLVAILNLEARRKRAFRRAKVLLYAIVRRLEAHYALYEARALGCTNSIQRLLQLAQDARRSQPDRRLFLDEMCKIVQTSVRDARACFFGYWEHDHFCPATRAWSVARPDGRLNAHMQHAYLHPNGISRQALQDRQARFHLTTGEARPQLCDETLHYMIEAPTYQNESCDNRYCCLLPLHHRREPVGVMWLLFYDRKPLAAEERSLLCFVTAFAGFVLGTALCDSDSNDQKQRAAS